MKRIVLIAVFVGIVSIAAVFGFFNVVSAQNGPNTTPVTPGQGYGRGGMMDSGTGLMQPYMEAALAEKMGLTVDELRDLNAQGKTFWQIAADKGFTTEQAQQMMTDARGSALERMVKDGTITQEQADWMKQRSGRMMGGAGQGGCMGTGTTRGGMMGGHWNR
jgi:hypothetical protein